MIHFIFYKLISFHKRYFKVVSLNSHSVLDCLNRGLDTYRPISIGALPFRCGQLAADDNGISKDINSKLRGSQKRCNGCQVHVSGVA